MSTSTKTVNNALVYYDSNYDWRWYDAFGPSVAKFLTEFISMPADDNTTDPVEWELNITEAGAGVSTAVLTDSAGGALLITTAADEDDGWQMQLAGTAGESVLLDGDYQTYFGCMLQVNDATNTDFLVGLCVTDTDCLSGVTDGLYFRKVDGSTDVEFCMEADSVEDPSSVLTMAAATDYILEFLFDGRQCRAYVDGTLATIFGRDEASFPNEEELRLTVEFLTGEDVANTCQISWLRLIHLRG